MAAATRSDRGVSGGGSKDVTHVKVFALPAVLVASLFMIAPAQVQATGVQLPCKAPNGPIVIAHRGASGYVPEHTLGAYALAIEMGADYVEPNLVMTKDGVLVARHENEISGTSDVADHPEFASRKTTKTIDGVKYEGWFTEDFTLAELKTLRAKERLPELRPANERFNGTFEIPTFQEVLDLIRGANFRFQLEARGRGEQERRCVGVYPETKHPTYHESIGLPMEEQLVHTLRRIAFFNRTGLVYIQSFEVGNLRKLSHMTKLPLVQLLDSTGAPYDFVARGDKRTYADLATPAGLREIATYADGIGVNKTLMIPRNADQTLGTPTTLISDAHAAGLIVHGGTFRAENYFLPAEYRSGADPEQLGDLDGEIDAYLSQGMDGFFTDQANIGVRARNAFVTP
jgi:glycerophosphoryl diester phosphodiesterase